MLPKISVVVSAYSRSQYNDVLECIDSLLNQEYSGESEIIFISENRSLCNRIEANYNDQVKLERMEDNKDGLTGARNRGAKVATGKVIGFVDDDTIVHKDWMSEIGETYNQRDVLSVGGKAEPEWVSEKPRVLPEEFYWLVGATHSNHPNHGEIVRNTFGCNITYKSDIFTSLGGFSDSYGKTKAHNLQAEESELGERVMKEYGTGTYYNSNAIVNHKVHKKQTKIMWLCNRSFWQGYSKSMMSQSNTEQRFLRHILFNSLPRYFYQTLSINTSGMFKVIGMLLFTIIVGLGYLYGKFRSIV